MKVEVEDSVTGFLRKRGKADVTLDVEDLETPCCVGRLPEMKISYDPPADPGRYRHFQVGGITIHLSKLLRTEDTLQVFLSGLGPFKKVEVSGINLVL